MILGMNEYFCQVSIDYLERKVSGQNYLFSSFFSKAYYASLRTKEICSRFY